jgi:hypothetical protein
VFAAAFVFLLGSVAAVALGQFKASSLAAWISLGYSAGAVACTLLALLMRQEP